MNESYKNWYIKNGKEYQRKYRLKLGIIPRTKRDNLGFSTPTIARYGYDTLKELKDNREWECSICKSKEDLTIHHKDRNGINKMRKGEKMNNELSNLEILCRKCHGAIHTVEASRKPKKNLWWHIRKKQKSGRKKGFNHSIETRKRMSMSKKGMKYKSLG